MTISKIYKCDQCGDIKSKANFYQSTKDPKAVVGVCISCFKENRIARTAGLKTIPGKDRRCRREREQTALNHKRQKAIDDAQKLYNDFDKRVSGLNLKPDPGLRLTLATTYQTLRRQLDEAIAEPVL